MSSVAVGVKKIGVDLFQHPERFRQFLGGIYVLVVAVLGQPTLPLLIAGTAVVVFGSVFRMWASGHIKKNRVLATDGPYGFVRHPLYVGNLAVLLGFAIVSGLWWAGPLLILMVAALYPPAIRYEDDKLHRLFGEDWERWRARTRALIPRLTPYSKGSGGWSFGQSLRVNGEPLIVLFLVALLVLLYTRLP